MKLAKVKNLKLQWDVINIKQLIQWTYEIFGTKLKIKQVEN